MGPKFLHIGSVRKEIGATRVDKSKRTNLSQKLIHQYFPRPNTQAGRSVLSHLQFLLRKDILGQDVFLLGSPGPFRRRLVHYYCHLAHRELESLVVTADTSEADLKERRELVRGNEVVFTDQAPLTAAVRGGILLLEDVHKAERNVLPTLNNLLENREMNLPSGRRLVHPKSSAAAAAIASQGTTGGGDAMTLVCSEQFRVIALGCPVPTFPGYSLDPPFRSRFQGRVVEDPVASLSALDLLTHLNVQFPPTFDEAMSQGVIQYWDMGLPWPPKPAVLGSDLAHHHQVTTNDAGDSNSASVSSSGQCYCPHTMAVPLMLRTLAAAPSSPDDLKRLVEAGFPVRSLAPQQRQLLPELLQRNAEGPQSLTMTQGTEIVERCIAQRKAVCLIGPRGCGKTTIVHAALEATQTSYTVFHCFKDMTTSDLLQRRGLDDKGNSRWQHSSIVQAALKGWCVVLDGLHRAPSGILGALSSLILDKGIVLPSGLRLLHPDAVADDDKDDAATGGAVGIVHPNFCVVGVSEPSSLEAPWITTETLSLFEEYVELPISTTEEVLNRLATGSGSSNVSEPTKALILSLSSHVSFSPRMSTRLFTRIGSSPRGTDRHFVRSLLERSLMVAFLPLTVRRSCDELLDAYCPKLHSQQQQDISVSVDEEANVLCVGDLTVPRGSRLTVKEHLVPFAPNFVPIASHVRIMYDISEELLDTSRCATRHFLLIGNQGTGKNKLCDAFLSMLWAEREYMQLNRDTTVASLTITPTVVAGQMVWESSPLLVAVQTGRFVIVDEADKAPLEAVSVLKALLWDELLSLPDGRVVRRAREGEVAGSDPNVLYIHPSFRCFVLANRPGFPFLGNDFFRECGDIFSTFVIENPDLACELELARAYGPTVSHHLLTQLCVAFEKLRALVGTGELPYPFSTRELINIVKHLNAFPEDTMANALRNTIDFDSFSPHNKFLIQSQFEESGLVLQKGAVRISDVTQFVPVNGDGGQSSTTSSHAQSGEGGGGLSENIESQTRDWSVDGRAEEFGSVIWSDEQCSPWIAMPVRDCFNEVAHDMRPVGIVSFTNPRSYEFTNLASESQLSCFAAEGRQPGRIVHKAVVAHATDTSQKMLLLLATAPQGLWMVPLSALSPDGSSNRKTESPPGVVSTTDVMVPPLAREVDLSFVGGRVTTIATVDECVVMLFSAEVSAMWFLTVGESGGKHRLFRVNIPTALYTGRDADGTSLDVCDGRTAAAPQTLGKKFVDAETFIECVEYKAQGDTSHLSSVIIRNTKLGIALVIRWNRRDLVGVEGWSPEPQMKFMRWECRPSHNVMASLKPGRTCLSLISDETNPRVVFHPLVAPTNSVSASSDSVSSLQCDGAKNSLVSNVGTATLKGRTVKDLLREAKERAASTTPSRRPVPTADQTSESAKGTVTAFTRQSIVGTASPFVCMARARRDNVELEFVCFDSCLLTSNPDTRKGTTTSHSVMLPVQRNQHSVSVVLAASVLACEAHPHADANVYGVTVTMSVLLETKAIGSSPSLLPPVVREELWHCRCQLRRLADGGATGAVVVVDSVSMIRLSRDPSMESHAGNSTKVHTAVHAQLLSSVGTSPRRYLLVVSSDAYIEWWDVDAQQISTSLLEWKSQLGSAHGDASSDSVLSIGVSDDGSNPVPLAMDGEPQPAGAAGGGGGMNSGSDAGQGNSNGMGGSGAGGGGGSGGGGGGSGGGSGSGANLSSDGKGGYSLGENGALVSSSGRRRQTAAKTMLSQSTGSAMYDKCLENVSNEILRVTSILEAAEAKDKERVWQGNRQQGELDDRKLIDAVVGETNVYRKRGIPTNPMGLPQRKPKYVDLLVDVSASMARFNAWDKRLDKMCEAVVMLLESARLFPQKFVVDVHGHSGSTARTPFLQMSNPAYATSDKPTNEMVTSLLKQFAATSASNKSVVPTSITKQADRCKIIEAMAAHSRSTTSGDGTLDALRLALEHCQMVRQEYDECFVILISDANLGGYGVTPKEIRALLDSSVASSGSQADSTTPPTTARLVFIAEKEASNWICKELPPGVGHHCPATKDMPQILREIFLSGVMS